MPTVRRCRELEGLSLRVGEERRLSSGATRRYITCGAGRPLLVQLPTCYTPGGVLHDFDEGGRLSLVPVDPAGVADALLLGALCDGLAARSGAPGCACPVDPATGEVSASAARLRDVRVFESERLAADDCPVLPGDTVTAIVSPDYLWCSSDRASRGICVRLVQVLLHTDRGRYPSCLAVLPPGERPAPPPPPPLPGSFPPRRAVPAAGAVPAARRPREPRAPSLATFRPTVMEIVTARNGLKKAKP